MIRKIIKIEEDKCNGCGACAEACHEGAIEMIDGKARLTREDYCDGLGDCLPECPCGAISFEQREAPAYNEEAVLAAKQKKPLSVAKSHLGQWPCQIKLVPVHAPYFQGADLLIAADCTAYAYAGIHNDYMKGRITLIGCPKLDAVDYSEKLMEIIKNHDIKSITVLRMEVPCCGGMEAAVKKALLGSGKEILLQVVTVSVQGEIVTEKE
ncbi:ferredoxin [Clostridiaceae bacterium]|nr:ferredoxin [Clostridiaceae bacterium]